MSSKELEQLHKRRQKAQDQGDIVEEAKLCNAIGEYHSENGDFKKGLKYHEQEICLSEAASDQIGAAIAHRKVGECHCELGNYRDAIHHQKQHLRIARCLGDLAEEQRALATLGRTYFVYSQSEEERGKRNAADLLLKAEKQYLDSLDICGKLVSRIPDRELLEMRSRLYLNLGLVYETQSDLQSARQSMEKALNIVKELGDSATIVQCYFDLGSLHLRDHRPSLALRCFQQTLDMAKEQKNKKLQVDALREIAQAHLHLADLQVAKSYLKKALLLNQLKDEKELIERQLLIIRKVLQHSAEVENTDLEETEAKLKLCEKLGDLCCHLKAYSEAIRFYKQQLDLAVSLTKDPLTLSPIYISLARTHIDCGQFAEALNYYNKELESCCFKPVEKCDTLTSIAKLHTEAGHSSQTVMEAYRRAASFAEESDNLKYQMDVYKSIVKFCHSQDDIDAELSLWEARLSKLLESHPELAAVGEEMSSDEEDSQGLDYQELSDVPSSLPSEDSEDEEEEGCSSTGPPTSIALPTSMSASGAVAMPSPSSSVESRRAPLTRSQSGVVLRKKTKLLKRNEKGETMLHVAAIQGNLATVKKLIREGADVNARDFCGWVPLHEACNHGHLEVVEVLLENNASIDDPGGPHCNGITPLIDAANNGHVDVVQLLLDKGADIMIKDQRGYTALDTVMERLMSKAESGQSYDLEEEHTTIRELLRNEMRRRGFEPPPATSTGEGTRGERRHSSEGGRRRQQTQRKKHGQNTSRPSQAKGTGDMRLASVSGTKKRSSLPSARGRFGSNLLYNSSSEEDEESKESSSITNLPSSVSTSRPSSLQTNHTHRRSGSGSPIATSVDNGNNPFENFTVGKKSLNTLRSQSIRVSEVSGQRSKSRLPVSSTVAISGTSGSTSSSRFNPLGQVEGCVSALIPENEVERWEYVPSGDPNDKDYPVIDDWLVDDLSAADQPPANKRKKQQSLSTSFAPSRREVRSFLEGTSSTSMLTSGEGRRKRPLQRKSGASSQEVWTSRHAVSERQSGGVEHTSKKRKTDIVDLSLSDSDERFLDSVIITDEDLFDSASESSFRSGSNLQRQSNLSSYSNTAVASSKVVSQHRSFNEQQQPRSVVTTSSSHPASDKSVQRHPDHRVFGVSSTSTHRQFQAVSGPSHSMVATSNSAVSRSNNKTSYLYRELPPPLRIKVKIESKSYLIPCSTKDQKGLDTTVKWLINEASERHYTQQGVRPRLSLTTADGAILCPSDPIVHVLSPNEEIVGVVEGWEEPTLEESYQTACKNAGVEPHIKTLEYLRSHGSSTRLDLSEVKLTSDNSGPLFKALLGNHHGNHTLTALILKGNSLGDGAMTQLTSALSHLPTLSELNLSRTGITAQGLESLARFSPTQRSVTEVTGRSMESTSWIGLKILNLSFNKLGVACGRGLAALLRQCTSLQELYLTSCRLGPSTFDAGVGLCDALKGLLDLNELNISLNPLGPEGVSALLAALPLQLASLNLRETCKKNRPITEAMSVSFQFWLESLDLSHCGINDDGLPTLVHWLVESCAELKELRLAGSSITESGIEPLCRYISSSRGLRSLDINGAVRLGNTGCLAVLQACCGCGLFNDEPEDCGKVCLKGCGLASPLPNELVELIQNVMKGRQGGTVDFSGNKIDEDDKKLLFSHS